MTARVHALGVHIDMITEFLFIITKLFDDFHRTFDSMIIEHHLL